MPSANIVKVVSATTGTTDPLVLGAAVTGFLDPDDAGIDTTDGMTATYVITDGTNREVGIGWLWNDAGTWKMDRTYILSSTNAGAKISCSGSETVALTRPNLQNGWVEYSGGGSQTITNTNNAYITYTGDEYWFTSDPYGIVVDTTSGELTVGKSGLYKLKVWLRFTAAGLFNGSVKLEAMSGTAGGLNMYWTDIKYYNGGSMSDTTGYFYMEAPPKDAYAENPDAFAVRVTNNAGGTITLAEAYVILEWVGEMA